MKRHWMLLLGGGGLLLAVVVASGFIKVRCHATTQPSPYGLNPMDERTGKTWQLEDGSSVLIARSYFTAAGKEATFHVEWQVPADKLPAPNSREALLALVRPVLRHAYGRGKLGRTAISSPGVGRVPVKRLRAQVQGAGTQQKREIVVTNMDELLVWSWTFKGRLHRIFGPGYYFDSKSRRVTLTMKWHDPTLCPSLKGIDDKAAFALAEPVLRRAAAWRLWRVVPVVTPKGIFPPRENVDEVGLELGCPDKNCPVGTRCKVHGYRVSRPLAVLRTPRD